jgi:predicted HTH transcriptional regulator
MSLTYRPLESVDEAELQALVENKVSEHKTLEYKRSLPGNSDKDKKEFLADVSSLANAVGGHLIYGIKEEEGVPTEVCGVPTDNVDAEILRLESIIRHGIDPRIPGLLTHAVRLETGRHVIIIRSPRSWAQPHMVIYGGSSRFYSRDSRGKYGLDVRQIGAAFALSATTADRIRNFRLERLGMIVSGGRHP